MKYWYDTEFDENGKTIELISIGIVSEDGRNLYLENSDADLSIVNPWVKENVIPLLWSQQKNKAEYSLWSRSPNNFGGLQTKKEIKNTLLSFLNPLLYGKPELWAYYGAYDHVAL